MKSLLNLTEERRREKLKEVRAKIGKDIRSDKSPKDLIRAYFVIYPAVLLAFSFLAFSVFTHLGYVGWIFYGATLPLGFFGGIMGLSVFDKIKI